MYILLNSMSTVPMCLKDMQDEMEKGIKRDMNHTKKTKIPLVKRF
jgi:hypothetical protein